MEIVGGLPLKYLRLESASTPMNLVGLCEFNKKAKDVHSIPPSLDALRHFVNNRLATIPLLRQRLYESPFHLANPLWLDDPPY